ncbi:MAG: 50S ribosomal protein L24 [Thermoguttaceae bacterium]|nr:50S ribosomal protein L24 [Thermoguttaceae bacterium]MDW8037586.1 50S ribosomal protein L24 [Thermoguttaceae bacterium]
MRLRTGDWVEVISGDDKGLRGKILRVDRKTGKILVEGVNQVKKHMRRTRKTPQGGILTKEMPLWASKVMIVCTKCDKPTRLGARWLPDGSKERFCKKCGASLGLIGAPRAKPTKTSAASEA